MTIGTIKLLVLSNLYFITTIKVILDILCILEKMAEVMKEENIKEEDEFSNKELNVQITPEESCTAFISDPRSTFVPDPCTAYVPEPELQVKLEDYEVKGNFKFEKSRH